jgi:predicted small secreted protein
MNALKTLVLLMTIMAGTVGLAACENTWRGAGQDIEETGAEMSDSYDGDNY